MKLINFDVVRDVPFRRNVFCMLCQTTYNQTVTETGHEDPNGEHCKCCLDCALYPCECEEGRQ